MDDVVRELEALINDAFRVGRAEREVEATLFEDVTLENEGEWLRMFHVDVPKALREILNRLGLSCSIYHRKDEINGFEYVANCVTDEGRRIALGFDVDYDDVAGEVVLRFASAWINAEWTLNQLVYYHEV